MKKNVSNITELPALIVFTVFAVCVLMVLLYGAHSYKGMAARGEESFRLRTARQYVATRVRQAETVTAEDFSGCDALTIREQTGGTGYITRVYLYDGYIRELYCAESAALSPQDGEKIIRAEDLRFSIEDDLLAVQLDGSGFYLQLRGKGGTAP